MAIITCWIFGIWIGLYGIAMGQSNVGTEGTQGIGAADLGETTTERNCLALEDLSPEIRRNMTTRLEQCFSKYGPLYSVFGAQPAQTAGELEKTYFADTHCITEDEYVDGVTKYIEYHETCGKSRLKRENSVARIKERLSRAVFPFQNIRVLGIRIHDSMPKEMTAEELESFIFAKAKGAEEYFRLISKFLVTMDVGPFEDPEFDNYYSMACPAKHEYEQHLELRKSQPKSPFDNWN